MGLNRGRLWLGGFVGGVVWVVWSFVINLAVIGPSRYTQAQVAGEFLKQPRYPAFEALWIVMLFMLAMILAHLYAWVRQTLGPGPKTALKVGCLVGFAAGFPNNFGMATWGTMSRIFPLGWLLEFWVGSILATLVAGALYKE